MITADSKPACIYTLESQIQSPTQRIRLLEERLRYARGLLEQLKSKGTQSENVDFNAIIEALECRSLSFGVSDSRNDSVTKEHSIVNVLGGRGWLVRRPGNAEAFFGPSSGFSFVSRTLELFLKYSNDVTTNVNAHPAMLDLFDRPIIEERRLCTSQNNLQDLPPKATTSRLLDSLFTRCPTITQLFRETDLSQLVERIHQPEVLLKETYNDRILMLAHSLLALGYLYHIPLHQTQGCQSAAVEA